MLEWFRTNQTAAGWIFVVSAVLFLGTLVLMPVLIARMRPDHYVSRKPRPESWRGRHPVVRLAVRIVKNAIGVVLLLAGILMLVLPGQGVITILAAVSLLEFPGKRRLELRIVRQRPVLRAIQWIRSKAGSPPLILPPEEDE
jgi:hypothetical protein